MLRHATLLFLCLSFAACKHKQIRVDNSLVRMHLKGNVHVTTETTWQPVDKNDSAILLQVLDTFNKVGLLTSEDRFYGKTSIEDSSRSRYVYQYDKNNNRVSDSMYLQNDKSKYYYYATHIYDSLGNMIRWSMDPLVHITYSYKYDRKGRPQEMLERDSRNNFAIRYAYNYDSLGNMITELKYVTTDDKEEINKLLWQTHSRYDAYNNMVSQKSYAIDSTKSMNETYNYQFDKISNWIKRITYTNGEYTATTQRQIVYY